MVALCPAMAVAAYRSRKPRESALWKRVQEHFDEFTAGYDEQCQQKYGPLRPVVRDVVRRFLKCGDLHEGFARVRCPDCHHEYLLAFSCKGRWFCPSCHQKKVVQFADEFVSSIALAVPHRHYVFALPILLRTYFLHDRPLLGELFHAAIASLSEYLREEIDMPDGKIAGVAVVHTFGEYLDFHPHVHMLVADGLFDKEGDFHPARAPRLSGLRELFRFRVIQTLLRKGILPVNRAQQLLHWKHSGFNLHRGERIEAGDRAELERMAQYIIRNPFSADKMMLENRANTRWAKNADLWRQSNRPETIVIYHSKINPKVKGNFVVFTATDFLAAVTQHIPDKSFQLVRYYGLYSNKYRGQHPADCHFERSEETLNRAVVAFAMSKEDDLSSCRKRRPCKKWRDLIRKIWEVDPLLCPKCGNEMKIVAFIDDADVIEKILRHLGLWEGASPDTRAPPPVERLLSSEPIYDDFPTGSRDWYAD